jgi:HD superfamily phosphodiesterase
VEPDALPAWAEEHAATLLANLGTRWQHVRGVARQAQRVSPALAPEDRPYPVAAAWLHDIGYAPDLAATSPTGQRITLADRLAEIAERYGPEHLVVRCLRRAHDPLAGAVQRTKARLRAAGVPE